MATLSLAMGAFAGLDDRAVEAGQILVTTDTAQMYVDINDTTRLELNAKTAKQVANPLKMSVNGAAAFAAYDGSVGRTVNFVAGNNITIEALETGLRFTAQDTTYSALPNPHALTWGSKSYTGASAQTITLADFGLTNVLHFLGTTTTAITDGSKTQTVSINSSNVTAASGDIVMYNGSEFIWTGTTTGWEKLGDEALWVPNTRKVSAGTKLTGGGDLSADRTISHAQITTTAPTSTTGLFVKNIVTDGYGHITQWENGDCSNLTLQIAGTTKATYDPFSGTAATFNVPAMGGASTSAAGTIGLVPAPAKGAITRLLAADGSWKSIAAGNGIGVSGVSIYNKGVMEVAAGSTNGTISVTKGSTNTANATATSVTVYTLPVATASVLGGTYGYTGLTLAADGKVSLTKGNITSLLSAASKTNSGYLTSTDFTTFSNAAAAVEWGTF